MVYITELYLGKIYFPRENLPQFTQGKFISGFIFPMKKVHDDQNLIWGFCEAAIYFCAEIENILHIQTNRRSYLHFVIFGFVPASKTINLYWRQQFDLTSGPKNKTRQDNFI